MASGPEEPFDSNVDWGDLRGTEPDAKERGLVGTLTPNEPQRIFEEQSRHAEIGLHNFPELARRLHRCRELSENESFDFLTWLEYPPAHEAAFNKVVAALRATEEWKYVEQEVDIRLVRGRA